MKTKFLFGAAALATLLTACSQDEIIDSQKDGIRFGMTTGNTTRALQSYCNNVKPERFNVIATNAGTTDRYFTTEATQSGANWVADGYFWPEQDLDFTAYVNAGNTFHWDNGQGPKFVDFQPAQDAASQVDLLYAKKLGQNRQVVDLNFRHALSQVVFKAVNNSTTGMKVTISEVQINHLKGQGTFEFPTVNTDANYENHDDIVNGEVNLPGQGTWTNVSGDNMYTTGNFGAIEVLNTPTDLTSVNHAKGADRSLILLPQEVEAWKPETNQDAGAYFKMKVKFEKDGKTIYDNYAYIPVNISWKQGVRYIYTFTFADGNNGGWTDPTNPDPVLSAISFNVTTDDFVPVEGTDVPMNGDNGQGQPEEKTSVITLDNGADAVPATQTLNGKTTGENCQIVLPSEAPVREGYDFGGWSDGKGNVYQTGETVTLPAGENLTLTAVWTSKYVEYTVSFDLGKYGTDPNNHFTTYKVKALKGQAATFTVPDYEPALSYPDGGYYWDEWTLDSDYDGSVLKYDAPEPNYISRGATITITGNTTLKAVYRETSSGSFVEGGESPWGKRRK